jgi:hypothetical protein
MIRFAGFQPLPANRIAVRNEEQVMKKGSIALFLRLTDDRDREIFIQNTWKFRDLKIQIGSASR